MSMFMQLWPNPIPADFTYTCECGFSTNNADVFEPHYTEAFHMGYLKGRTVERERCAMIAETAFEHMSPLAIYEVYRGQDRPITRLNPEASARAIAAKIRSGK